MEENERKPENRIGHPFRAKLEEEKKANKVILKCRECKHEMNIKNMEEFEKKVMLATTAPKCEECGGNCVAEFKELENGETEYVSEKDAKRIMYPVLRPVRDEVVLEFTAVAGEPLLGWDLKSEKRVMVVDKSPSPEEGYNKHQLILTPIRPNEIDIICLDVKLITRPGENTVGFSPEHWLSKVKVGYGFGPKAWVKTPLYAWESRVLNSQILFGGVSSFNRALKELDKFSKEHPGLIRGAIHDFREYLRRESDRHHAAVKAFIEAPRDKLSILTKTWYMKSLIDHRSQARHWMPGEDLYLYIEPDEVPMSQVRFAVILWGFGYHEIL